MQVDLENLLDSCMASEIPPVSVPKQLQVRLKDGLHAMLEAYCVRWHREPADVVRAVLHMFLASGVDVAEERLLQGVWERVDPQQAADLHEVRELIRQARLLAREIAQAGERARPRKVK